MADFTCPKCNKEYSISDLELWEVYEDDGKETELTCGACDADMIITSRVTGWEFEATIEDE